MTDRIDYDAIAPTYDDQPYRSKEPDPTLVEFARKNGGELDVLDVACGTGNQIVANLAVLPDARFTGVDASAGMLAVARRKAPGVTWVESVAESLPLEDGAFDYVTCQFAYHHFADLESALAEIRRVIRSDGVFVLVNASPYDYRNSRFYQAFPAAWERDRGDFRSGEEVEELLREVGFDRVAIEREHVEEGKTLGELLDYVSVRENNSHLTAIDDAAYAAGIVHLQDLVEELGPDAPADNPIVILRAVAHPGE